MGQLADYLPQPTTWFSKTLTYSGIGRIEFSNPRGWVQGEITCEVNHLGNISTVLKIRNWENFEEPNDPSSIFSRDWLLSGHEGNRTLQNSFFANIRVIPQPMDNTIVSLTLQTTENDTLVSENVISYDWDHIENTIELDFTIATHIVNNRSKTDTRYWVLPCINLNLGHPFGTTEAHAYKNLRQHPMRVFPVPDILDSFLASDASEEDKGWVRHNVIARSYIVGFFYNNQPAFIERLPNYDTIIKELVDGQARLGVTSLMIGAYSSETDELGPVDLLPILGFATGRPVGASWIEFRDEHSDLVYRIHGNFGRYTYGRGRPVVHDAIHHGGLGKLLTEASKSTTISDSWVRGDLRSSAKAISGEDVTEILYYLFTSLDTLFEYYHVKEKIHPIQRYLSSSQIAHIQNELDKTANVIKAMKTNLTQHSQATVQEQKETIDKVAQKTKGQPLDKRTNFADKLLALMEELQLEDKQVLIKYFTDIESWLNTVNIYRNTTMHHTHYHDVHSQQTRKEVQQLLPHLIDILVRVLLKTVGYTGNYAPYTHTPNHSEEIGWVDVSTLPSSLGYK